MAHNRDNTLSKIRRCRLELFDVDHLDKRKTRYLLLHGFRNVRVFAIRLTMSNAFLRSIKMLRENNLHQYCAGFRWQCQWVHAVWSIFPETMLMMVQCMVFIQKRFWAVINKFPKDTIKYWQEGDWPVVARVQFINVYTLWLKRMMESFHWSVSSKCKYRKPKK